MDGGFDFTWHMRRLCADLASRLPELEHVDTDRVAIRYCQARKRTRHGVQATLSPMRFLAGSLTTKHRGRTWTIERLYGAAGRDMLYLLSFYLPRFMERSFEEKLATVVHELWHISPNFDGDLRRHSGRCWAHSHSQAQYDAHVRQLALKWLTLDPEAESCAFLRFDFGQLQQRYGRVFGQKIRTPRLLRASDASSIVVAQLSGDAAGVR